MTKLSQTKCPRCHGALRKTKSLSGDYSAFWKECSNTFCGTLVDTFKPFGMQYNFLKDEHKYKGVFGGYGSGKSLAIIEQVIKHALITPGGYVAVIGFTYKQIKRNQKIPGFNQGEMVYTFKNGCKVELITSDDVGKIRGLNATLIIILEASNVAYDIFKVSKSRIRNRAAMIVKKDGNGEEISVWNEDLGEYVPVSESDWMHILLESNPDSGWINKQLLLEANRVQFYGQSYEKYSYKLKHINDNYSLHISSTDVNPFLPDDFFKVNTEGLEDYEIRRFYMGSFLFGEHMIYPKFNQTLVDPYPINFNDPNVFVVIGYDYGLSDLSAFVFGALNFKKHLLTIYDTLGVREMNVKEIAKKYREKLAVIPDGKLLFLPKMDAKSYNKRDAQKITIGSLFEDIGLLFDPIQEGQEVRMMKVRSLIDNEQLQIFRTLTDLIDEGDQYKFKVNSKGEVTDKRVDKRNHYMDALEFAVIKIPFDLEKARIMDYIKPGQRIVADLRKDAPVRKLTPKQKWLQNINPLNFTSKRGYEENDINLEEADTIISKLSGI